MLKLKSANKFMSTLFLLMFSATSIAANASGSETVEDSDNIVQWLTYVDPRFDFEISYPSNWSVVPREDSYGAGGTVAFIDNTQEVLNPDPHDVPLKVEIGSYLVEPNGNMTLQEWSRRYNDRSEIPLINEIDIHSSSSTYINGNEAVYEEGASALTDFRYVNIERGSIVWFIWTNSNSEDTREVFNQIIGSFKFGKNTPYSLYEAYGADFQPYQIDVEQSGEAEHPNSAIVSVPNALPFLEDSFTESPSVLVSSSWRSPLNGGSFNVSCTSTAHSGSSNHAIDIARPAGTLVVGANTGDVYFAGWDTSGYGNLVKARTGTEEAFYAHLQNIDWTSIQQTNPWRVTKHSSVGWVGSTGNSSGNHLHFHVRNTSNNASVTLAGMTTFSPTAGLYPESGNPCGTIKYP